MRAAQLLRRGVELLDGFTFDGAEKISEAPDNLFSLFVKTTIDSTTPEDIRDFIADRVVLFFTVCTRSEDVYRRLRGDQAFYYLILANWNSEILAAPLPPARIEELFNLFVTARRRYVAKNSSAKPSKATVKLVRAVDCMITIVDDVDSHAPTRRLPSLSLEGSDTISVWPPTHFNKIDVAMLAETATKKALFGIDHQNKMDEGDIPKYPHDQDVPLHVRHYLCWLALTHIKPGSKISLFLTPVAFTTDEKRQEWYKPTGHKSRFYATFNEFISYAHGEFKKTGKGAKQHVIGLFTPWFFEVDATMGKESAPLIWQKSYPRSGTMVSITKIPRKSSYLTYRLVIFKPGLPHYPRAAEPPGRRAKQDAWIEELVKYVNNELNVAEGWIGGKSQGTYIQLADRRVSADSVEVSCEIIEEIILNPNSLPTTDAEFLERGFQLMD
ncbi:hypothetical protein F4804DRAFT_338065 [Jackrogersella minutella]|nr:hypothetical protein F4804DRAFT_338065 [Jackrogersella minutella]